ncbi:MAG TPA: aldehyde dehydrogenase family protein, partial [Candidatus Wallbacteria bacterium]|nr:aldehyde dehydrogenase family protein [Candidatus Wallbacteria bacterium]
MFADEHQIKKIVEDVIKKINTTGISSAYDLNTQNHSSAHGIFTTVEDAVRAASLAYREYKKVTLQKRHEIIKAMRDAAVRNAEVMAREAHEETKMGRVADKVQKNLLSATKTPGPEALHPRAVSGDRGLTLEERAPYGVIASITPSTNPVATVINNSITMLSAGNTVVYNFHPSAKKCCAKMVSILNDAIVSVGGPKNLINAI